jgi:amino acid adenylation domain-containing protein
VNALHGLSSAKRAALERLLRGDGSLRKRDAIQPRLTNAVVPISPEQEHVWLHAAMAADVPLYNEAITIHRSGPCNVGLLEASFNEVVRRHEIWRTSFAVGSHGTVQRVHEGICVRLPLTDLTGLPLPEREAAALQIATDEARLPFDLGTAPLLRGRIVKLSDLEHRLYLTLHHIIFDGVSIYHVLMPTLTAIYADLVAGIAASVAGPVAPTLQYADYALWRAARLESDSVAQQLAYWSKTLTAEVPVMDLPSDHPRPRSPSYRGDMATFALSTGLTNSLKETSLKLGITLYGMLLAVFQTLLFRYTGQTDLIIGAVVDMRRHRALEPLMGYFLNSLPIRTRPGPGMPFRDYARQTSSAAVEMLAASDVPFSHLVRALQPRRSAVSHPLFQVLFSIEPPAPQIARGWDLTQMDVPVGSAKFDLYLELDERPEGLIGRFLYSTDLFKPSTIQRMIGHWCTLIEAAVADPDCALENLQMLTLAEKDQIARWNDTAQAVPDTPLNVLFETRARCMPAAVAVASVERTCTYGDLNRQADDIAGWLCRAGVKPGVLVAVCLERSVDMIAALLATLKAGAAYMPIDPTLPSARLADCLREGAVTVLLTRANLLAELPHVVNVLLLDDLAGTEADSAPLPPPSQPDDLAYVLCTSGTTGRPKAVEITHRAVVNLLTAMQHSPGFGVADSLLAVTTASFDIAALEFFLPLLSGGRVILADRETAADPFRLAERIHQMQPTVMQATPSTWRALVDAGWPGLPGLKILVGGEALPRDLADALLCRADSVWNMYGPTETTIWSTVHRVQAGNGIVPIGRPIANTVAFVLDPYGNQVPVGVSGELYLGGAGIARGYRLQNALTLQRFNTPPSVPMTMRQTTG